MSISGQWARTEGDGAAYFEQEGDSLGWRVDPRGGVWGLIQERTQSLVSRSRRQDKLLEPVGGIQASYMA